MCDRPGVFLANSALGGVGRGEPRRDLGRLQRGPLGGWGQKARSDPAPWVQQAPRLTQTQSHTWPRWQLVCLSQIGNLTPKPLLLTLGRGRLFPAPLPAKWLALGLAGRQPSPGGGAPDGGGCGDTKQHQAPRTYLVWVTACGSFLCVWPRLRAADTGIPLLPETVLPCGLCGGRPTPCQPLPPPAPHWVGSPSGWRQDEWVIEAALVWLQVPLVELEARGQHEGSPPRWEAGMLRCPRLGTGRKCTVSAAPAAGLEEKR